VCELNSNSPSLLALTHASVAEAALSAIVESESLSLPLSSSATDGQNSTSARYSASIGANANATSSASADRAGTSVAADGFTDNRTPAVWNTRQLNMATSPVFSPADIASLPKDLQAVSTLYL
jgi:hypothetical protein